MQDDENDAEPYYAIDVIGADGSGREAERFPEDEEREAYRRMYGMELALGEQALLVYVAGEGEVLLNERRPEADGP